MSGGGKAYLSFPISGKKLKKVHEDAERYKKAVKTFGFKTIVPTDVEVCAKCKAGTDTQDHSHLHEEWMRVDLTVMLEHCEAIVLCPGWQTSHGARAELSVALAVGMRILMLYEVPIGAHESFMLFDTERGVWLANQR